MSILDSALAIGNAAILNVLGLDVQYTPMSPPADPVTVKAIEGDATPRSAPGHFANISFRPSDLSAYPREGDEVTLRGILFRVKNPDPIDPAPGEAREDWVTVELHKKR
jgi:hypothetical protein